MSVRVYYYDPAGVLQHDDYEDPPNTPTGAIGWHWAEVAASEHGALRIWQRTQDEFVGRLGPLRGRRHVTTYAPRGYLRYECPIGPDPQG